MLSRFGDVTAIESDATARDIARRKTSGRFAIGPGSCPSDVPFEPRSFELVCLFDVLEHIDDDVAALARLRDLLVPGGFLVLTVPAHRWMWGPHDEFLHHKRRYTRAELLQKTRSAGLEMRKLSYFNTLLAPLAVMARLTDRMFRRRSAAGTTVPAAAVNASLRAIFASERTVLRHMNLPWGISMLAVLTPA